MSQTSSTLPLTGHVDILQARALHARALAAYDAPGDVTLDWSAAESVDGAGVQLLLALRAALVAQGRRLLSDAPPDPIARTLAAAGVLDLIAGGAHS